MHTLTRAEVARQLGKSIATVRRLEYRVLFPSRDARGILRFEESEVDRARRDPASLRVFGRSQWFEDKVRDDAHRRREAATRTPRRSKRYPGTAATFSAQLANDLQATLCALFLRFNAKQLRVCGLDVDLFARAFDVVQRLRKLETP